MSDSGIVVMRPIDRRIEPCVVCHKNVVFQSCTAPDDECPEMCRFPPTAWIGIYEDVDHGGQIRIAICCSEDCMRALVR